MHTLARLQFLPVQTWRLDKLVPNGEAHSSSDVLRRSIMTFSVATNRGALDKIADLMAAKICGDVRVELSHSK